MAIPKGWSVQLHRPTANTLAIGDVRAICPHCRTASTFKVMFQHAVVNGRMAEFHLVMGCNYSACQKIVYVDSVVDLAACRQQPSDSFFMYPSGAIDPPHPSFPTHIGDDWIEAQRAIQAGAPKGAAVMLRRVLYDVLIDKGCKLHPLKDGLKELIQNQRLPAIFDEWLPAIKDDGHDGAHPDRALAVSTENVSETLDYTSELLRFLYIEPFEFLQRKARNATSRAPAASPSEP